MKFAAIEMVPKTSTDVPETLFGHLNKQGEVQGGIPIPGLASIEDVTPIDPGPGDVIVRISGARWNRSATSGSGAASTMDGSSSSSRAPGQAAPKAGRYSAGADDGPVVDRGEDQPGERMAQQSALR